MNSSVESLDRSGGLVAGLVERIVSSLRTGLVETS